MGLCYIGMLFPSSPPFTSKFKTSASEAGLGFRATIRIIVVAYVLPARINASSLSVSAAVALSTGHIFVCCMGYSLDSSKGLYRGVLLSFSRAC